MDQFDSQIDEPALKAVLQRGFGAETAPASLRNRIIATLDHEVNFFQRWRRPIYAMTAIAAVLILVSGIAFSIFRKTKNTPVPEFLASAMVYVHDQYAGMNVTPNIDDTDLTSIRLKLYEQVHHPVLVAMLNDGWQYRGADVVEVSSIPAAHLFFTRGDEAISIFSIGLGSFYETNYADTTGYAKMEDGQPISGFVYGGAVHCLVGYSKSGKISLSNLTRIRDELRLSTINSSTTSFCEPNS